MSGEREELHIKYLTDRYIQDQNAPIDELYKNLLNHLSDRKTAEMDAQICLVGPHKDDIEILINEKPA